MRGRGHLFGLAVVSKEWAMNIHYGYWRGTSIFHFYWAVRHHEFIMCPIFPCTPQSAKPFATNSFLNSRNVVRKSGKRSESEFVASLEYLVARILWSYFTCSLFLSVSLSGITVHTYTSVKLRLHFLGFCGCTAYRMNCKTYFPQQQQIRASSIH